MCKKIKRALSMFYTLIKHGFLNNQSVNRVLSILQSWYNICFARNKSMFYTVVCVLCLQSSVCFDIIISNNLIIMCMYHNTGTYWIKTKEVRNPSVCLLWVKQDCFRCITVCIKCLFTKSTKIL